MILDLKGIYKDYQQGKMTVPVLKDVDFSMEEGEYVAIMGPSGSGKTTLMNIIGCLDKPTKGTFLLNGEDIAKCTENEMSDIRLNKIGFVFQSFHLLKDLTALDNVKMALILANERKSLKQRMGKKEMIQKSQYMLERLGMKDHMDQKASELSGGQQQRVAIARALIAKPRIVFADEPTGNLDTRTGEDTMRLLMECAAEFGQTLIVVTHNPEIAQKAQQVIRIEDGQIFYSATPPMSVSSRGNSGV